MDPYDAYLDDLGALTERDSRVRLTILDTYAHVESELIAVGVFYLGGASMARQEAIEQCIGHWGGINVTIDLVRRALPLHGLGDGVERRLASIQKLRELRNVIAHSRVTTWHANHPDVREGRAGRDVLKRSNRGAERWERIDFDDAERIALEARAATDELSRTLAEITRGEIGTHEITYGPEGPTAVEQ